MGIAFLHGNGGSGGGPGGSELTIVGGTIRPAKVAQNTIWINTDVEIAGYALSATEPENPAEGMVWITIDTSGNIKAVSPIGDDWVMIYLSSSKQYISGTWVSKEAKSYQNGTWVELVWWNGELYAYGDEYESATGGWSADSMSGGTVTFNTNNIYLAGRDGDTYTVAGTVNSIDLSKYTKLVIKGTKIGEHYNGGCFHAGVASARGRSNDIVSVESKHTGDLLLEIDISSVDSGYVQVGVVFDGRAIAQVDEVYLQ